MLRIFRPALCVHCSSLYICGGWCNTRNWTSKLKYSFRIRVLFIYNTLVKLFSLVLYVFFFSIFSSNILSVSSIRQCCTVYFFQIYHFLYHHCCNLFFLFLFLCTLQLVVAVFFYFSCAMATATAAMARSQKHKMFLRTRDSLSYITVYKTCGFQLGSEYQMLVLCSFITFEYLF